MRLTATIKTKAREVAQQSNYSEIEALVIAADRAGLPDHEIAELAGLTNHTVSDVRDSIRDKKQTAKYRIENTAKDERTASMNIGVE